MGPPGSVSAGSVTGPLYWTATGGTTYRSAQDRSADIANVLDFGADPTGVADSAPAFNAAAATFTPDALHRRAVYVPAGTYRLNRQVSLIAGQTLFGDGRGSTILTVDQAFSPSASAVISLGAIIASGESGCEVRDFAIRFAQPSNLASRATMKTLAAGGTSGTGGTGIMYPPAILLLSNSSRNKIQNVRIGGAWIGIRNTASAPVFVDNVEMGALSIGMDLGTASVIGDFCHINAYHFWCFDLVPGGVVNPVFADGQTIALQLGNVNGFVANDLSCFIGRVVFTSDAQNGWFHIANLQCDTDQSTLEIGGAHFLRIVNFYSTSTSTGAGRPRVAVQGPGTALVVISNWWTSGGGPNPQLAVTYSSTDVTVSNAQMYSNPPVGLPTVLVSAGTLRLYDAFISLPIGTYTAPVVSQTGGALQIDNVAIGAGGSVSGSAVTFAVDSVINYLGHVIVPSGMTINLPATYSLGNYTGPSVVAGSGSIFPSNATSMILNSAAGNTRQYRWQTAGVDRWMWAVDGSTESGSNAGSNLFLQNYSDTGSLLSSPIVLNRASGGIALLNTSVTGQFTVANTTTNNGMTIDGSGNSAGAIIRFAGDGATTPTKYIRVHSGAFQILNSAYSAVAMSLSDAGNLSVTGSVGFNGTAPVAKPTISGACAGNTAIKNLLTALAATGILTDSTSA